MAGGVKIDVAGHHAIVTGGVTGLGYAIAERLVASGADVAIWDLNQKALDEAAARLAKGRAGSTVIGVLANVADAESVDQAFAKTKARFGTVEIAVNNAGISGPNAPTWEYPVAEWRKVIDVDLTGTFLVCRAAVPGMRERNYGRIVNVASVAGKEGNPNAPAYSAAKAGAIGLTKSLGKELAATGITVNCVTPAAVRTALFDQMTQAHIDFMLSKIPMNRFGMPDEIAALVAWLCSPECSFSTGAVFDLSGGRATY